VLAVLLLLFVAVTFTVTFELLAFEPLLVLLQLTLNVIYELVLPVLVKLKLPLAI
jgi:hypothetical protein